MMKPSVWKKLILRPYCHLVFRPINFIKYQVLRLHLISQEQLRLYESLLLQTSHDHNKQTISFVVRARKIRCPNHNLNKFLKSLYNNTASKENIEVIIAIDKDDDIKYYVKLQQKYDQYFKCIVCIAPERYGYKNLQCYDKITYRYLSTRSLQIVVTSDDIQISRYGYDKTLSDIQKKYKDDIYIISTFPPKTFARIMAQRQTFLTRYDADDPITLPIMSMNSVFGCFANYPIFSTSLMRLMRLALDEASYFSEEEKEQWSPISNSWAIDRVLDLIMFKLYLSGYDRILSTTPFIIDNGRIMKFNHAGWRRNSLQLIPIEKALLDIFNRQSIQHINNVVEKIISILQKNAVN